MSPIEVPKPVDAEVIKTPEQARDTARLGINELRKKLDESDNTPEIKLFLQKLTHIQNDPHTPEERAKDVRELLDIVKNKPALAENRDLMDFFRQALEGFVITKDVKDGIKMNEEKGGELKKSLNINSETLDALDEWTRQIIRRIHTGFYQFDPDINGWVDALGGRLFLWPENIDGIEQYLMTHNKNHPFLTSIRNKDFRSNDSTGKYAFTFTGKPHNMFLAEADYMQNYIALRAAEPTMTDEEIVAKLRETHAVTVNAQWAINAFEQKYGATAKVDTPKDVTKQLPLIEKRLENKYTKLQEIITGDASPELKEQFNTLSESRPEMKEILYDIQTGYLKYDTNNNTWMTYHGTKIEFNTAENTLVREVIAQTLPEHPLYDTNKTGPGINEEREKTQYTSSVLEQRVYFYQQ
jgi:hypothetical protein